MKQYRIAIAALAVAALTTGAFAGEGCCASKAAKKVAGKDCAPGATKACDKDTTKSFVKVDAPAPAVAQADLKK